MKSVIFTLFIVITGLAQIHGWQARICDDADFNGNCVDLDYQGCKNLDEISWCWISASTQMSAMACSATVEDKISSINTKGLCVRLYEDKDCIGDSRRFYPGSPSHSNLADIDFNNKASSIKSC